MSNLNEAGNISTPWENHCILTTLHVQTVLLKIVGRGWGARRPPPMRAGGSGQMCLACVAGGRTPSAQRCGDRPKTTDHKSGAADAADGRQRRSGVVEDCFLERMGRSKTADGAVGDCNLSSRGGRRPLIAAADGFSLEWRTAKCRSPQFKTYPHGALYAMVGAEGWILRVKVIGFVK